MRELPALTTRALKEHRATQSEQRLARGSERVDLDLVFCTADGSPWNHTHATHLFHGGIHPKMVSERLGHSKVGITLDLCTRVTEGMDRDAADKVGELLTEAGIAWFWGLPTGLPTWEGAKMVPTHPEVLG